MIDKNVNFMSLGEILKEIQEELVKKDEARQEIQTAMRKAGRLSKQAIFTVHKDKLEDAKNMLKEAERIFANLNDLSRSYPELLYMGTVDSAFQEYAEACVFLGLVKDRHFVGSKEIKVQTASYVLGLSDVIGELRRRALNFLRKGKTGKAEECLELMETIYMALVDLDEVQFLIPGLRRKCDIARRVIEATRGDVTLEVRRSSLENSIRELKKSLGAKR
jgi:translin